MPFDWQNFWIVVGCRPGSKKPALIGFLPRDDAWDENQAIERATKGLDEDFSSWRLATFFFDERERALEQAKSARSALKQIGVPDGLLDATLLELKELIEKLTRYEIERALIIFESNVVH